MAQRIGGARRKTRHKLAKSVRQRGKMSIAKYMRSYKEGETVILTAEPSVQKAMYHPRFHGKSGLVVGKRGVCYEVLINDTGLEKMVVVHPVHIKKG